jgi:hypothetical protein
VREFSHRIGSKEKGHKEAIQREQSAAIKEAHEAMQELRSKKEE